MAIDKGSKFLSDLVLYRTYSATKEDGTKESRSEMYDRVANMHKKKYPHLEKDIDFAIDQCKQNKVLGSQRAAQFAGPAIEKENLRMYNCAFLNIETFQDIGEFLFILACGTGCGVSVKHRHVDKLPVISSGVLGCVFVVPDTKEGWADSCVALLNNPQLLFDYSNVRAAGSPLSSGGTASGPEPLNAAHAKIKASLTNAVGRQLKPIEIFDICGYIADVIVAGGSRRSACIALFDADDVEMLTSKSGNWWEANSQRGRFNISAHILRTDPRAKTLFNNTIDACFNSNAGEPGILWTNDLDEGTQPCVELSLRNNGLCNLSEVNVAACRTFDELSDAVRAAVILGTLQAGYTSFGYIKSKWAENCKDEALLGVSLTGLAENWEILTAGPLLASSYEVETGVKELIYVKDVLAELTKQAIETNKYFAQAIGINTAARICCVKPSGCVHPNTLVMTDRGLLRMSELGNVGGDDWQDVSFNVAQKQDKALATKFFINGEVATKKIHTRRSGDFECTPNHQIQIIRNKELIWCRADGLDVGDIMPYRVGGWLVTEPLALPEVDLNKWVKRGNYFPEDFQQPEFFTEDFAYFLGNFFGDGSVHEKGMRISGCVDKEANLIRIQTIIKELFNVDSNILDESGKRRTLYINSVWLSRYLNELGLLKQKSHELIVPVKVRKAPKEVVKAFINGFIDADGHRKKYHITLASTGIGFIKELLVLARGVGIDFGMRPMTFSKGHKGTKPMVQCYLTETLRSTKSPKEKKQILTVLDTLGLSDFSFDVVTGISDSRSLTYDITVPDGSYYLGNSFISHNTASAFVGTTSGIHAAHDNYYIRRVQIEKSNPVAQYLLSIEAMKPFIVENVYNPNEIKIEIPINKENAITRNSETALELLERAKFIAENWIHPTHTRGKNKHNVSLTVSYKKEEEAEIKHWMWLNRYKYNGISLLPFDGGSYQQMPFESISKEKYEALIMGFPDVSLAGVNYKNVVDDRKAEAACAAGGSCEWGI